MISSTKALKQKHIDELKAQLEELENGENNA